MQDLSYATRCLSAKAVNFLLSFAPTPAIQRLTFNWLVPLPTSDQLKFLLPVPERHFEPFRNHPVPMVPSGLSEHGIGAATATVTFIFKIASISAGGCRTLLPDSEGGTKVNLLSWKKNPDP